MNKIKVNFKDSLGYYKIANFLKEYIDDNTVIVCVGTDRCIGDSLGPLVGTNLINCSLPIPVYGTIHEPIHALNISQKFDNIKNLHPNCKILGIDACLGDSDHIGEIHARVSPIHPGKGVGKTLPTIGDFSIVGIVDSSDQNELFTNRNIRLSLIYDMAKLIARSITHAYCLYLDSEN